MINRIDFEDWMKNFDAVEFGFKVFCLVASATFVFIMMKWFYNCSEYLNHFRDLKPFMVCLLYISIFLLIYSIFIVINIMYFQIITWVGFAMSVIVIIISATCSKLIEDAILVYIVGTVLIVLEILIFLILYFYNNTLGLLNEKE